MQHGNEIPPNCIWHNLDNFEFTFKAEENYYYMANRRLPEHWMGRVVQLLALDHKHVQVSWNEIEKTCYVLKNDRESEIFVSCEYCLKIRLFAPLPGCM